jgi:hypothetical protein
MTLILGESLPLYINPIIGYLEGEKGMGMLDVSVIAKGSTSYP